MMTAPRFDARYFVMQIMMFHFFAVVVLVKRRRHGIIMNIPVRPSQNLIRVSAAGGKNNS